MSEILPSSCIAIVGAGKGGTSILKLLLQIPGVEVKYICDSDTSADGMVLGQRAGVHCISSLKDSAIFSDTSINLIFEATGKKEIFNYLQQNVNTNCTVIGSASARIIYYLLDGQQKITEELQQCKLFLSQKVMDRTEELEKSNRELQRQINEYQDLNDKLQQVNEEKTKYLVNATHQLKAPFAAVQSYTELLLEGYADALSGPAEVIIKKMKDRCVLLSRSIKEMLELANLNSFVEENLIRKNESLVLIVQEAIDSLKPVAEKKEIKMDFHEQTEKYMIACNRKQIEALIQILIENAINYSDQGGSIRISIKHSDQRRIALSIQDEGIGIEEKNLKNIFREYFRTNRAVKKSYNGSGLGLAIAKRIAELHRSEITVDSIPGRGSVFKVDFPSQRT